MRACQLWVSLRFMHPHRPLLPPLPTPTAASMYSVWVHPGASPGANRKSISHGCYLREEAFEWELTKETIYLPRCCLQGGCKCESEARRGLAWRPRQVPQISAISPITQKSTSSGKVDFSSQRLEARTFHTPLLFTTLPYIAYCMGACTAKGS